MNSKVFSNELAAAWSLLGAGTVVDSAAALRQEVLARLAEGAVLVKDPYGVSGGGAQVIQEAQSLQKLAAHLDRQEAAGRRVELLVQPLFARRMDFSFHFEVTDSDVQIRGLQEMQNDGLAFQCVRAPQPALRQRVEQGALWRLMANVATALRRAGYVGPVCVDAMLLCDGRVVPLLEINARKSMGLLHLRLRQRLALQLQSELRVLPLVLRRVCDSAQLLTALREADVLFDGQRGWMPLAAGPLLANAATLPARGRLYALLAWRDEEDRQRLIAGGRAAFAALAMDLLGRAL